MILFLEKYNSIEIDYYLKHIILYEFINEYFKTSNAIITKLSLHNEQKYLKLYNYFNSFAKENIDFKISVFNEFKKYSFIEERSFYNFYFENPFKKLLQVLSCTFRRDRNVDAKDIYEKSNSYNIQQKAKKIVGLIINLNKQTELLNQSHLVKPTNCTLEACCLLPDLIVDNEKQLKKLIDFLYKIFWENKEVKKYSKNNELDFINSFRRYFFHDLDHGKKSDYRKKVKKVSEFYKLSCEKNIPQNSKDWQKVQEKIYDLLILFLKNIELQEKIKS